MSPIPGCDVRVVQPGDDAVEPVPWGEEGELVCAGPNVMLGYHNLPEADAEVFATCPRTGKRFFRTGDLARCVDSPNVGGGGAVRITGRVKELYKLANGKYIVPGPIENAIQMSAYISQAMVVGEGQQYNGVLVFPDYAAIARDVLERTDIPPTAVAADVGAEERVAMARSDKVRDFVLEEVQHYADKHGVRSFEVPRKVTLITEELSTANGLLTPKMSMKRNLIADKYSEQLSELFQ